MRPTVVGNDVVDLLDPRTVGKADDERFVRRVLDDAGRAALRRAEDADLELWCRWAAKEAAYKVVSKLAGTPPPFVHRAFVTRWGAAPRAQKSAAPRAQKSAAPRAPKAAAVDARGEHDASTELRRGSVHYRGRAIPVVVRAHLDGGRAAALHAVASSAATADAVEHELAPLERPGSAWAGSLDELRARFSERELDAVGSLRSAAVRLGARAFLAHRTALPESRIEIVCDPGDYGRRPPRVLVDGAAGDVDVSLSHDGRWIAWAAWTGARDEE